MDELKKLENTIKELLGEHNCVTVPGLGSFIYRETPASSNHFTLEIKPSGNSVFFNNAIVADDGILANFIREKEGLTYSEALNFIGKDVDLIKSRLEEKRNIGFGSLGNFFLNAQQQVFFLPSSALNLSKASFGLPIIKLDELQKQTNTVSPEIKPELQVEKTVKPAVVEEAEFEEAEVLEVEENGRRINRGMIWKVAAGFAIVTLAGSGWYFGRKYFEKTGHTAPNTAALDTPAKENITVETPKTETESSAESPKKDLTETKGDNQVHKEMDYKPTEIKGLEHEIVYDRHEIRAEIVSNEAYMNKLKSKKGNYYLMGGMFIGEDMAKKEIAKWNTVGVNATIYKPKNSSLYRIVLGRFDDEKAASDFIKTMGGFHGSSVSVRDMPLLD